LGGNLYLHEKLRRKVVVDCIIETEEPLHVGVGKETLGVSEVDSPTMVDSNDKPIIPGSSIKGALRAHITRLLLSLDESTCEVKFGVARVTAGEETLNKFQRADIQEKMEIFRELGVIDKLFGVSGYASPLRITDATLTTETRLTERTHVQIDIETDRAKEGRLFSVQAVPEKRKFGFKLVFDEPGDDVIADVSAVFYGLLLKQLSSGLELFLGGMKSRGYGFCTIKAKQVVSYSPEDLALGETPEPIRNISEFINSMIK